VAVVFEPHEPTRVTVRLRSGAAISRSVEHGLDLRGEALTEKFMRNATPLLGFAVARQTVTIVAQLERVESIAELLDLLSIGQGVGV
jgi:hypothetical protein